MVSIRVLQLTDLNAASGQIDVKGRKKRILLVEDDAVFRRGLAQMFPLTQYQVMQVDNGPDAIAMIDEVHPDLVICDYRLPGADGLAVLNHLREAELTTPFILVTAHYSEELAERARADGVTAIFEKPIALDQFRLRWQLELGQRQVSVAEASERISSTRTVDANGKEISRKPAT